MLGSSSARGGGSPLGFPFTGSSSLLRVFTCKMQAAGSKELQAWLHSKAPGPAGNLVNVVLFHLLNFTSSTSDVKKSQARIFLQWHMFSRNLAMTLNIY